MSWTTTGHDKNKRYFEFVAKVGFLSNAYLFSGPEMVGKKKFAHDLVRLLNNREPENNPDLNLFSHSVEDARNLKSFLSTKPYYGPYKIAIIDDAEQLTIEASNALLKILEKPSLSSVIILISSKSKTLLPTITSRCQEIRFELLNESDLAKFLPTTLKAEDKNLVRQIAHGRPGWIVKNLEKIGEVKKDVQEFDRLLGQGIFEKMQYAARIYDKEKYEELINNLIYWYYPQTGEQPAILKNLLYVSKIISQPQYNHRLALENFLL